jgi:hypothetical protein
VSAFDAPFLTAEDLRHARQFANLIERPQDDMASRWIRGLVATVEHERAELDQQRIRAETAEAELDEYRAIEIDEAEAALEAERRAS